MSSRFQTLELLPQIPLSLIKMTWLFTAVPICPHLAQREILLGNDSVASWMPLNVSCCCRGETKWCSVFTVQGIEPLSLSHTLFTMCQLRPRYGSNGTRGPTVSSAKWLFSVEVWQQFIRRGVTAKRSIDLTFSHKSTHIFQQPLLHWTVIWTRHLDKNIYSTKLTSV